MANWLQKTPLSSLTRKLKNVNLPALRTGRLPQTTRSRSPAELPPASIIYGVGAAGLFVMALYLLFTGRWFTAILVALLGVALLGFAMHFLKR